MTPPGTFRTVEVFERAGASFRTVELPDLRYPESDWPHGTGRKSGTESISALRWVDADTLLLERTKSTLIEDGARRWRLTTEITLHFSGKEPPVVKEVRMIKVERNQE
jgi:hypothetical protein